MRNGALQDVISQAEEKTAYKVRKIDQFCLKEGQFCKVGRKREGEGVRWDIMLYAVPVGYKIRDEFAIKPSGKRGYAVA